MLFMNKSLRSSITAACLSAFFVVTAPLRGGVINYTYDAAGRLIGVDYGTNRTTSFAYDNAGNLLQSASPAPSLATFRSGNQIVLVWPLFPAGFSLQTSPSLGLPSWSPAGGSASVVVNQFVLTLTAPATTTFYRLVKP